MTLAAIDWLSISINLLLVIFVIVCLLMTLLILMQRPKQEGLGAAFGGGVTDQVFGARTTNVLQRGTVYLGSLFFLISLALAVLISANNKKTSILEPETPATEQVEESEETPAADDELLKPKSLIQELPTEDTTPADATLETETPAPADAASETPVPTEEAETPATAEPSAPTDSEATPVAPEETAAPADAADTSDEEPAQP